ncbi:MAG: hypothetical protein K6C36_04555 [Clostridia bacterium]|nr:hypothetical protein [Clostridia bacterium]
MVTSFADKSSPEKKKIALPTVAALVFLMLTRFAFLYVDIDSKMDVLRFVLYAVYFVAVCGACVFKAPRTVSTVLIIAGAAGLTAFICVRDGVGGPAFFIPAACACPLVFFADVYPDSGHKDPLAIVRTVLMHILPLVLAVAVVMYLRRLPEVVSSGFFFTVILYALISGVLFLISRGRAKQAEKTKKQKTGGSARPKAVFLFAAVTAFETGIYLALSGNDILIHTLSVLLLSQLAMLYDAGNAPVCAFFGKIGNRIRRFVSAREE